MTNTKFRKRALLSSVAMLLVALVALGSATFAWFTDDPNADAIGFHATANTGMGLVASTTTDTTYSHHPKLYNNSNWADFVLTPATTIDGVNYFTASAAAESAPDIKTGTGINWQDASVRLPAGNADADEPGAGVYHEQILLKTTPGSAAADIKMTGITITSTSNKDMKNAVVVLVKYGSTIKEFKLDSSTIAKWTTLSTSTATSAANGTAKTPDTAPTTSAPLTLFSNIAADTAQTVDVYVYLDGAHSTVYTNNAVSLGTLIDKVEFDFTATAAA